MVNIIVAKQQHVSIVMYVCCHFAHLCDREFRLVVLFVFCAVNYNLGYTRLKNIIFCDFQYSSLTKIPALVKLEMF